MLNAGRWARRWPALRGVAGWSRRRPAAGSVLHDVLVLSGGTALAQAIPIAVLPLLTRIYQPSAFGLLALFTTVTGVTTVLATGRYELAVVLPAEDEDADAVVALALAAAVLLSVATVAVAILGRDMIATALGNPRFAPWVFAVAASILLTGALQTLNYRASRRKQFGAMAQGKVAQTTTTAAAALAAGAFGGPPAGLIVANLCGTAAGATALLRSSHAFTIQHRPPKRADIARVARVAREYADFPLFYAPGALCDNAAAALPIVILTRAYGPSASGLFGLTTRIVAGPAGIVSASVGQVLFQRLVEARNAGRPLTPLLWRTAGRLAALAAVPLVVLIGAAPLIFSHLFGRHWTSAGRMAQIMAVGSAIKFVVSPLSTAFAVLNRVKIGSAWQILYLATTAVVLWATAGAPLLQVVAWWTGNEVIAYLAYFALIIHIAHRSEGGN